jgi:hypothetical protein
MEIPLESNSQAIWSELNLGSLVDSTILPLEAVIAKIEHEGDGSHPVIKHEKQWTKPNYAVLKSRYQALPYEPPVLNIKKIDRLADPIRGRFKQYDELMTEIVSEETGNANNDDGIDLDFIKNGVSNNNDGNFYRIPPEFQDMVVHSNHQSPASIKSKVKSPQNIAFFLTEGADNDNDSYNNSRLKQNLFNKGRGAAGGKKKIVDRLISNKKSVLTTNRRTISGINMTRVTSKARSKATHPNELRELMKKRIDGKLGALDRGNPPAPPDKKKIISSGYGASRDPSKKSVDNKKSRNKYLNQKKWDDSINNDTTFLSQSSNINNRSMNRNKSKVDLLPGGRVRKQRPASHKILSPINKNENIVRGSKSAPTNSVEGLDKSLEQPKGRRLKPVVTNVRVVNPPATKTSRNASNNNNNNVRSPPKAEERKPTFPRLAEKMNKLPLKTRTTEEVIEALKQAEVKESKRSHFGVSLPQRNKGKKSDPTASDSDNINTLLDRVKNIGQSLSNAQDHMSKYKELMAEN